MTVFQQAFLSVQSGLATGIEHIQQRLVVLIHQHHATTAIPLVRLPQNVGETVSENGRRRTLAIIKFSFRHILFQLSLQLPGCQEIHPVEIHMEHRVFKPFGLQFRHRQALEKFLPALVIAFERGDQKALAEPPGAAQGIHPSRADGLQRLD